MTHRRKVALLSRRQAADMLAVSVDTIARLIERGELRPAGSAARCACRKPKCRR
jgi:hypothetical protein